MLEWTEIENDLVALITLPATFSSGDQRHSILEAVQLTNEEIGISGRTIHAIPGSWETPVESVADSEDKVQH